MVLSRFRRFHRFEYNYVEQEQEDHTELARNVVAVHSSAHRYRMSVLHDLLIGINCFFCKLLIHYNLLISYKQCLCSVKLKMKSLFI